MGIKAWHIDKLHNRLLKIQHLALMAVGVRYALHGFDEAVHPHHPPARQLQPQPVAAPGPDGQGKGPQISAPQAGHVLPHAAAVILDSHMEFTPPLHVEP